MGDDMMMDFLDEYAVLSSYAAIGTATSSPTSPRSDSGPHHCNPIQILMGYPVMIIGQKHMENASHF